MFPVSVSAVRSVLVWLGAPQAVGDGSGRGWGRQAALSVANALLSLCVKAVGVFEDLLSFKGFSQTILDRIKRV